MKKIFIHLCIIFILCGVFCDGYFSVYCLSNGRIWNTNNEVYATDNWEDVTKDDLVTAFRYYCKSRNLTIDGSIADALTSFTTSTFNNICDTLGIDITSLQADLKKTVEGNLGLRFLMNQQGVLAYNRIFAEFLQNNDLSVGDQVNNKTVYSGKYIVINGYKCLVYITKASTYSGTDYSNIIEYGTKYKYNSDDIVSLVDSGVTSVNLLTYTYNIKKSSYGSVSPFGNLTPFYYVSTASTPVCGFNNKGIVICKGDVCIYKVVDTNNYYLGTITTGRNLTNGLKISFIASLRENEINPSNADVAVSTGDNVINNNNYSKNYTIIYNEGDYYEDDDEPSPSTTPSGGGGGGGGDDPTDPDDPEPPDPSGPEVPDWEPETGTGTIGSDGIFHFDMPFTLPDLNIDWSLKNIGHKFPFCIPSDIVSFYQVLAVEPEAPSIDAHIPLGSFYDWHFEADFTEYDNWARIIRIVEYVGFVITLIYFTIKLVKG